MVKKNSEEEKKLKEETRRLSIKEGLFWTFRQGFGDHYVSPFAIAMQISSPMVALINTFWNASYITQIFGARLTNKFSRKSILTKTVLINSLGFLLLALVGFLYLKDIYTEILPLMVLTSVLIIVSTMGLGHPAWFSWMGDIVNPKYRGRWWAKRSTIITFSSLIITIIASFLLEFFKKINFETQGFILFFLIAFIARFHCISILKRHYEPKYKRGKPKKIRLKKSLKTFAKTNFGKFAIFRGILSMTMMVTIPLVSIYLLRYLNFNYPTYIIISLSSMIFSVFTLNLWGKIADRYGNYRTLVLTTVLIPLVPLLWVLSSSKIYLFIVPGLIGGIGWHGFILASRNFIYDNVKEEERANSIAHMNLLIGIGAIIGGFISAALIKFLNVNWVEPIIFIFVIGTILRMVAVFFFIPKIREIKKKKKLKGLKELERLVAKELKPTLMEDFHEIESIKNYLSKR